MSDSQTLGQSLILDDFSEYLIDGFLVSVVYPSSDLTPLTFFTSSLDTVPFEEFVKNGLQVHVAPFKFLMQR